MAWVELERAIVGRYRFLVAIHSNEQVATIVPGVDMARIRDDGSIETSQSIVICAKLHQADALVVVVTS